MEATALDPRDADVRVEYSMARAEVALRSASMAYAEQLAAIDATLREARAFPEVFVGESLLAGDPEAGEFAERAAIADLAVRLSVSEVTIRAQAHEAHTLMHRAPRVWAGFRDGTISTPNAKTVTDLISTLPDTHWHAFESAILMDAATLAPARFRTRARVVHDRTQPEPAADRHRRRAEERRVWIEPDIDGMAFLTAYLPADQAQRAMSSIDRRAASLAVHPDETRTMGQLRADVAADLLAGILGSAAPATGVSVAVTVPVLTALGVGEEPGILEGYGPIDADTARRLAAHAPSFIRILTHPITGTILDIGRERYRVPADLKRWIGVHRPTCDFPGCGRKSKECDLDHTIDWAHGGTTSVNNLSPLCLTHHRLKHKSDWSARHTGDGLSWTSPTGAISASDPPPF